MVGALWVRAILIKSRFCIMAFTLTCIMILVDTIYISFSPELRLKDILLARNLFFHSLGVVTKHVPFSEMPCVVSHRTSTLVNEGDEGSADVCPADRRREKGSSSSGRSWRLGPTDRKSLFP
jgi:hypothetical protein